MIKWDIPKGSGTKRTVTCRKTDGTPITLSGSETFNCVYWSGEDRSSSGTLTYAHNTPASGKVDITVSAAITAALGVGEVYEWSLALSDASATYARGRFEILAGPGSAAAPSVAAYCSLGDVLEIAPWVRLVTVPESDQAGFIDKRVMARKWFDGVILANYRGSTSYGFSDAYGWFSGSWRRRSSSPDRYISDQLEAGNLVVDQAVISVCAKKTIGLIGRGQIGINNQYAVYGRVYDEEAEADCSAMTVMIDTDADGVGDIPIPLGSTNTLFT